MNEGVIFTHKVTDMIWEMQREKERERSVAFMNQACREGLEKQARPRLAWLFYDDYEFLYYGNNLRSS